MKAQEDFSGNTTAHKKVVMTTIVSLCICLCLRRGVNQALRNIFIERDFNCQRINSVKTRLWLAFLSDWRSDIRSKRSDSIFIVRGHYARSTHVPFGYTQCVNGIALDLGDTVLIPNV